MTPRRVAVVGGGVAGLLAAHRLRALGAEPVLFEATAEAGGVVRSVRRDGWLAEAGPNTVAPAPPEVRPLLEAAGVTARIVAPSPAAKRRYLVHEGAPVPVPLSVADLVATPLLSVAGRLRLLREPFVARGGTADESVDTFARRRFGDEVAERLIDPLMAGTSGGDPARLLARFALPKLVEYERGAGSILKGSVRARSQARRRGEVLGGAIWSCAEGLGEMPARLAAALGDGFVPGARVVRVVAGDGDGVALTFADGHRATFDAAVLACPAPAYRTMELALPGGRTLEPVATMPHATLLTVSLGFPRAAVAHPLDGFGLLAPSRERRAILGVLFPSSLFAGRAPDGMVLLTTFLGGARDPGAAALDDEAVQARVQDELRALLGVGGAPAFREITRWPEALPQAVAGHDERLAAAGAVEASGAPIAFAGAWRDGLAVGEAMLGGVRAAERLLGAR